MQIDLLWNLSKVHPRLDVEAGSINYEERCTLCDFLDSILPYAYRPSARSVRHYRLPITFHLPHKRWQIEKMIDSYGMATEEDFE